MRRSQADSTNRSHAAFGKLQHIQAAGKDAAAILSSKSSRTESRPQPVAQSIRIGPPRSHATHA